MNIFERIARSAQVRAMRLGCKSRNEEEMLARRTFFAAINPSGFREPEKDRSAHSERGNRRRAAAAVAWAKEAERRAEEAERRAKAARMMGA